MIGAIKQGIAQALDAYFPNATIYNESIEQGFKEPCFYIKSITTAEKQFVGNRYKRSNPFDVMFFPDPTKDMNDQIEETTEKLYCALEHIAVGGSVKGVNMRSEPQNGVLHFFVNYNLIVRRVKQPPEVMGSMHYTRRIKG